MNLRICRDYICSFRSKFQHVLFRPLSTETQEKPSIRQDREKVRVTPNAIERIKKLSLIDVENERGVTVLNTAIDFAERLRTITIDSQAEPLYSTLENEHIPLRNDDVCNVDRKEILKNAMISEDDYFIVPLNIVLKKT